MNGYSAFVKKEFVENIKNFRFLILFVIFLIFGLTSAPLAKFTPKILSALAAQIQMNLNPVALDAWGQFYKNISSVGFSALIILFGSCFSSEYSKGTLILMVTKGLSRPAIILAKYTVASALMTFSYWMGFVVTFGYTAYLWPDATLSHVVLAAFFLWVIGFLYLSILILGCVLFNQAFSSILFAGGMIAMISLLSLIKPLEKFSPFILTSKNVELISGKIIPLEFIIPMIVSITMTVIGLLFAIQRLNKKQL